MDKLSKKVFITGATGFLGSSICNALVSSGYTLLALRRKQSDTFRVHQLGDNISWLYVEDENWQKQATSFQPNIMIHTAWDGVTSLERNDLPKQINNLNLTADLLAIAKNANTNIFIALGSQAEYGSLNKIATEEDVANTTDAYSLSKVLSSHLIELFCENNKIEWYWLRVFSVFGETESPNWLIPSLVTRMLNNEPSIQLSSCIQKYAYLYIEDFAKHILQILEKSTISKSGIYNISASNAIALKEIILSIKELIPEFHGHLDFGALPQRQNQAMHIEGDMYKYHNQFGKLLANSFTENIQSVINYHKQEIFKR